MDRQSEDGVRACSRMLRFPLIFSFQARTSITVRLRNPDHITADRGLGVNAPLKPKLSMKQRMSQDDHSRVSGESRVEKFGRILLAFPFNWNIFEYQGTTGAKHRKPGSAQGRPEARHYPSCHRGRWSGEHRRPGCRLMRKATHLRHPITECAPSMVVNSFISQFRNRGGGVE